MAADEETQRQVAELAERLASTRRIREAHQRRLYVLQEQAAQFGKDAPAHILTEIADLGIKVREANAEIQEIERRIARLELAPQSGLSATAGITGPAVIPELLPAVVDTRLQAVEHAIERIGDAIAYMREQADQAREESREWRSAERSSRETGQRRYDRMVIVLIILAAVVVLIAVKVY